ncbi:MAG: TetR family transcriptional regulator [Gammaproteobacteria bacterium]|nr:MAG: TetR family transcriptional regulator [Gammaproteobacteria bacterium]TND06802.1 MAG: TetR family transcriptional regulator [Gammaproteobacteria bacterium]
MNTTDTPYHSDAVRRQIVDAAHERFRHYGYQKTTMAEVARDVGMSAANLYRYFRNKLEIATACAGRYVSERHEVLHQVIHLPGKTARARLESFALAAFRHTRKHATEQPRINDLFESVTRARHDLLDTQYESEQGMIADVLAQGNESKEFDVKDILGAARAIHTALLFFSLPRFATPYPAAELEQVASAIVGLMVLGLARRQPDRAPLNN